jgi:long-subunit fatty acid transport protein
MRGKKYFLKPNNINIITMKRVKLITAYLAFAFFAGAQTEFDAFKYLQPDIMGTARYSSMAGAFGALGADPSAIKDNPAGLGIYRSSEFTATLNTLSQTTNSEWMRNYATDGLFKAGFNQFSYVISSVPGSSFSRGVGMKRSNWSFSYHRLKDFNRQLRINGGSGVGGSATDYMAYFTDNIPGYELYETDNYNPYNNISIPWISAAAANAGLIEEFVYDGTDETAYWGSLLEENERVSPTYYQRESGHMDEFSISWSGNFNNRLFLGATMNIYDMKYTVNTEYMERFSVVGNMSLKNYLQSRSSGMGFRLGAIYIPEDYEFIRFGASLRSPIVYTTNDVNYLDLHYNHGGSNYGTVYTPRGSNDFKLQSPLVYNLSAALINGKDGVIGIEYINSKNYTSKFMEKSGNSYNHRYVNDSINVLFNAQHTIKIGGEYKLNDNVAVRAGYALSTSPVNKRINKEMDPNTIRTDIEYFIPGVTRFYTGGIGYREAGWSFDFAVVKKEVQEDFFAFNPLKVNVNQRIPSASVLSNNLSILATVGFRF